MRLCFPCVAVFCVSCEEYLVVLVGCHSDEGSLGEDVGAESRVFWAEAIILIGLDDMEARLVFVHGVENYLHGGGFEKVRLTDLSCFQKPHTGTCWDQVESRPNLWWITQISWTAWISGLDSPCLRPVRVNQSQTKTKKNKSITSLGQSQDSKKNEIMCSALK